MVNFKKFGSLQWFGVTVIVSFIGAAFMFLYSPLAPPVIVLLSNGVLAVLCLYVIDWRAGSRSNPLLEAGNGIVSNEALSWDGLPNKFILLVAERHSVDLSRLTKDKVNNLIAHVADAQLEDYPALIGMSHSMFLTTKTASLGLLRELSSNPLLNI